MQRMKYWIAVCAALLIVFSAKPLLAATDITGTWVGDLNTADGGTFPLKFNIKQDGSKFTGNVLSPDGDPLPISDGKYRRRQDHLRRHLQRHGDPSPGYYRRRHNQGFLKNGKRSDAAHAVHSEAIDRADKIAPCVQLDCALQSVTG